MIAALGILLAVAFVSLYRVRFEHRLSPDGAYYVKAADGTNVPSPYSRRWLMPLVLGAKWQRWAIVTGVAYLATGLCVYALTHSLAAVWLWAWLPGWALCFRLPVLTDMTAAALMLGAIALERAGQRELAVLCLLTAGQCKESAPIFGAILAPALAPWALGSTVLALGMGKLRAAPPDAPWLVAPFTYAMRTRDPMAWKMMLLPWGAVALLACFATPSWWLVASVALGYGQLLIATDHARLYQWAAFAVLMAIPWASLPVPLLVGACMVHPFVCGAGKGI